MTSDEERTASVLELLRHALSFNRLDVARAALLEWRANSVEQHPVEKQTVERTATAVLQALGMADDELREAITAAIFNLTAEARQLVKAAEYDAGLDRARADEAERERDKARAQWQKDLDSCNTIIDEARAHAAVLCEALDWIEAQPEDPARVQAAARKALAATPASSELAALRGVAYEAQVLCDELASESQHASLRVALAALDAAKKRTP